MYNHSSGNSYSFDIGPMNWKIGAWRQLIKVAPVLQIVRTHSPKVMVDLGSGMGNVHDFLEANDALPKKFMSIDMVMPQVCKGHTIISDITSGLPLGDESVDCVVSLDLLQNLPEDDRPDFYSEIDRILKPGGVVYLFYRNKQFAADADNTGHHISGETAENIGLILNPDIYIILGEFGVNAPEDFVQNSVFPNELNKIFYSNGQETSKFSGTIMKKREDG